MPAALARAATVRFAATSVCSRCSAGPRRRSARAASHPALVHADVQQRRQQVQQRPGALGVEVEPAADHRGGRAAATNAQALREVVTFNWEMVQPATGEVLAVGLEFLRLDEEGRVVSDYQFIVS